jgi:hypothetical protein
VFKNISLKDDQDIAKLAENIEQFKPVLNVIGSLVKRIEAELGESKWYELGQDRPTRVSAKYEDVVKDLEFITSRMHAIAEIGQKQQAPRKQNVSDLQAILVENNLLPKEKADGKLNPETISGAKNLEIAMTKKLESIGIQKSFENKIVDNNEIKIETNKLREIIEILRNR